MKNTIILIAAAWLAAAPLFSQNEKGVSPLNPSRDLGTISNPQSTWAVVIGISDYQEKEIPDLRFADRDAEAFANFLRSPAGGSLDNDHLQVLTNQNATAGQVAAALDWLLEQSKEGDEAIIYFSGHGDVEGKKLSQPGFLLCWDAPSRVYMGGGTYSLSFLQEIVSTLSVQNKAKVVVITDACHAGKLAGSQIGGAQLTSANLARQYANEVKILSCQPTEFSLEGEQWGGGRGVFSYHLVDGLAGLADRNGDGSVSLGEIDRYLEDHVTVEAAPQSQVPMLLGNKTERLAAVNAAILADLKKAKTAGLPVFAATESRGLEEDVLAKLDQRIVENYVAFKLALKEKRFSPMAKNASNVQNGAEKKPSAEELYAALSTDPGLAPLHGFMKRNYAAALQDDAQQVMNKWLKTDVSELGLSKKTKTDKYQAYPRNLERAAELLGPAHYMYPVLKSRKHFFEGYLLALSNKNPDRNLGNNALAEFRQALQWQADLPQAYLFMMNVFAYNMVQPDSAEQYAQRAIQLNPSWVLPYTQMAFAFADKYHQFDRARQYMDLATAQDSSSAIIRYNWGVVTLLQQDFSAAEKYFKEAILLDSTYAQAFNGLALSYKNQERNDDAEGQFHAAIRLDPTSANIRNNLGILYHETKRFDEAKQQYRVAIEVDSTFLRAYFGLGNIFLDLNDFPAAEQIFKKSIQLDSTYVYPYGNLGIVYYETHRLDEAAQYFNKVVQLDSTLAYGYGNLFQVYRDQKRFEEAEKAILTAIARTPKFVRFRTWQADMYRGMGRVEEAERLYLEELALDPGFAQAFVGLAGIAVRRSQNESAWSQLENALNKGFGEYQKLLSDPDLAPLHALPKWGELMKKHFPDQVKD